MMMIKSELYSVFLISVPTVWIMHDACVRTIIDSLHRYNQEHMHKQLHPH